LATSTPDMVATRVTATTPAVARLSKGM
jgi:hypothetical protein